LISNSRSKGIYIQYHLDASYRNNFIIGFYVCRFRVHQVNNNGIEADGGWRPRQPKGWQSKALNFPSMSDSTNGNKLYIYYHIWICGLIISGDFVGGYGNTLWVYSINANLNEITHIFALTWWNSFYIRFLGTLSCFRAKYELPRFGYIYYFEYSSKPHWIPIPLYFLIAGVY
jgi:hypothetical protein